MRGYKPDRRGLAEIGKSAELQRVVEKAAQAGADYASSLSGRTYRVEPETVQAGYANEPRAGAAIVDDANDALIENAKTHALDRAVPVIEAWQP